MPAGPPVFHSHPAAGDGAIMPIKPSRVFPFFLANTIHWRAVRHVQKMGARLKNAPKEENVLPSAIGQATQGNRPPGAGSRPLLPPAAPPNPEQAEHGTAPDARRGRFQERHAPHTAGIRRSSQKKAGAPQMGMKQAQGTPTQCGCLFTPFWDETGHRCTMQLPVEACADGIAEAVQANRFDFFCRFRKPIWHTS